MIHFNDRGFKEPVIDYCREATGIKGRTELVEYAIDNGLLDELGHLTYSGLTLAGQLQQKSLAA